MKTKRQVQLENKPESILSGDDIMNEADKEMYAAKTRDMVGRSAA